MTASRSPGCRNVDPERFRELLARAREEAQRRYALYEQMARVDTAVPPA